jgi:mono/diheme cytochrome c family protein
MRRLFFRTALAAGFIIFAALLLPSSLRAQSDAAKSFKTNCVSCHAADGSGSSPAGKALKAKDLRSQEVQQQSDAELALVINKGKGKMPAFGGKLKDDGVTRMVAYVRELAKTK